MTKRIKSRNRFWRGLIVVLICVIFYGTTDAGVARMVKEQFGSEPWVHAIKGVRHCPMIEAPERFNSVLGKVLAE